MGGARWSGAPLSGFPPSRQRVNNDPLGFLSCPPGSDPVSRLWAPAAPRPQQAGHVDSGRFWSCLGCGSKTSPQLSSIFLVLEGRREKGRHKGHGSAWIPREPQAWGWGAGLT